MLWGVVSATLPPAALLDLAQWLLLPQPLVLCALAGRCQLAYTVLHLQWHEELVAKTLELLLDELNALASDATPLSSDWRTIVNCRLQHLYGDLARAFGAAVHHGGMGVAERVDALAVWQLGRWPAQRIIFATMAALAIDGEHVQLVVHASPPSSMLEYVHETGHVGRNSQPARCVMLVSYSWQPPPLLLLAAAWQCNNWQSRTAFFCATPTLACRWQRLTAYLDGNDSVTLCNASSVHACNACHPASLGPSSGMLLLLRMPPTVSYAPAAASLPPSLAARLSGRSLPASPPPPIFSSPSSAQHPTAGTAASGALPVNFTRTLPAYSFSPAVSSATSPLPRHVAPSAFLAAAAAKRSSVHGSSDGHHSSASSGVDVFCGHNSLPQQVKRTYPPLMEHFLQYCILCTLHDSGDVEHGTDKCAYAANVLDFTSPQEGALNVDKRLTFADYGNCYYCFNPF